MNTKQIKSTNAVAVTSLLIALLFIVQVSRAQSPTKGELREQKRVVTQEEKELKKEKTSNILEQAKNVIKEKIKKQIKGKLVAIAGTTLTIQSGQTIFTVTTTDKTEFKRKFGATSSLSEFSLNDQLLIIGNRKKNSDGTLSSSEIEASYIRNMSIQRRFAVFTGEVVTISGNIITLKTQGRGMQTVHILSTTEYKEKNKTIKLSDIQIGDKIVVKGELWNRASGNIDAKTILKLNFKKPTPTVTKTPEKE